jgi:transposase
MGRPSRFDSEFRDHAVELVRVSKKSRGQIAADLGVSDTTLANWMKKRAVKEEMVEKGLTLSERQELDQLRGEKREWVLEREILKKATAFWVKESNG